MASTIRVAGGAIPKHQLLDFLMALSEKDRERMISFLDELDNFADAYTEWLNEPLEEEE
jgi:hypothetical protein